jgi:PqqD family protein of HPr-rel-A system
MAGMAGPLYSADPRDLVRTVQFDGLIALFHIPSGTTHILAPPAPQILDALQSGPATVATILARMRRTFEVEAGRDATAIIRARLDELEAAGLVRQA